MKTYLSFNSLSKNEYIEKEHSRLFGIYENTFGEVLKSLFLKLLNMD